MRSYARETACAFVHLCAASYFTARRARTSRRSPLFPIHVLRRRFCRRSSSSPLEICRLLASLRCRPLPSSPAPAWRRRRPRRPPPAAGRRRRRSPPAPPPAPWPPCAAARCAAPAAACTTAWCRRTPPGGGSCAAAAKARQLVGRCGGKHRVARRAARDTGRRTTYRPHCWQKRCGSPSTSSCGARARAGCVSAAVRPGE